MHLRIFVEKREGFADEADRLLAELRGTLGLAELGGLRLFVRYDLAGLAEPELETALEGVLADPVSDVVHRNFPAVAPGSRTLAVSYLPGQYDQRADSAAQCLRLLNPASSPAVVAARVFVFTGGLSEAAFARLSSFLVNPVDSRVIEADGPFLFDECPPEPPAVAVVNGFRLMEVSDLAGLLARLGLAMRVEDLAFIQEYFKTAARRDPTLTEIRLLDTYWSDHCRHTTFLSHLQEVCIPDEPAAAPLREAWESYRAARSRVYGEHLAAKPVCLMDLALMGMRLARLEGLLPDLEESEEVNAASIVVPATMPDGSIEEWLVMFKNETHNHPTEIEPFGGAATCLGGAIRDPLSGRAYVYQALRVSGAGDPRQPFDETLPGKLPQRSLCLGAAAGFSSYGNQIGLATGMVAEYYHPRFVAKRMEVGAVVGAAPRAVVQRGTPQPGDRILLVGGATGRDGIGGATGSSKGHDETSLANGAEVQKGDPVCERKLQRLFRIPEVARMIVRCNDFGAGGVCVAVGELAPSLDIDLDQVPLKYAGLDGTELAISESQERMAVVVRPEDVESFIHRAAGENLACNEIAQVTDSGYLRMTWRGQTIVELARNFLDSNGVMQIASVRLETPDFKCNPLVRVPAALAGSNSLEERWKAALGTLEQASRQGLVERFDSTIGGFAVLHPFGGRERATPAEAMCSRLPLADGASPTVTFMSHGYNPVMACWSPFHGALYAVLEAVSRVVAAGGELSRARLSLQEYFPRLREDPTRWGLPTAALLGAFAAQRALGLAAIGGKDSMSGSFNELDVPPTLVAFALCPGEESCVRSPEFKTPGQKLVLLRTPIDALGMPDWEVFRSHCSFIQQEIRRGSIRSARSLRAGGLAEALAQMAFGNALGFVAFGELHDDQLFLPGYGSFLLEVDARFPANHGELIGHVHNRPEMCVGQVVVPLESLRAAWVAPLESVYPQEDSPMHKPAPLPASALSGDRTNGREDVGMRQVGESGASKCSLNLVSKGARPRVLIPVFPGTNCEFDSARAFREAGGEVQTLLFRNRHRADIEASIEALAAALQQTQILHLPGGFSSGDEPDGSGKFMAAVLRHPRIAHEVSQLLEARNGLVLGICNGFQALIKTGLLPHGRICSLAPGDPTLTHNRIGRHVSQYVTTRVLTTRSPWLSLCQPGDTHILPVSHGEGRLVAPPAALAQLAANGQIATIYTDSEGTPATRRPHNPNGSDAAIEGLLSPDGRIFGKMGHSERHHPGLARNIPDAEPQPLFRAGLLWFS